MTEVLASKARITKFDEIDSTSAEAKRCMETGATAPVWFIAARQTAGYGRRGRGWDHERGNFAGTFLFEPGDALQRYSDISFIAAIAVAEALRHFSSKASIHVKWPNDVLLEGGKIAGILPELIQKEARKFIALGIGVNLTSAPAEAAYRTASLAEAAAPTPSGDQFLTVLDRALTKWRKRHSEGGFGAIREKWLDQAAGLGREIVVRLPDGPISGVFEALDDDGRIILRCEDEVRKFTTGEIFFPGAAPQDER